LLVGVKKRLKRRAKRVPASVRKRQLRAAGRKLSLKRQRAAAAYVGPANGVKAEAARMAGYEESTATHKQSEIFDARTMAEVRRLLQEQGLTDEHAAARLYQATNALETKFWQGIPVADCVAHDIRLEAVRTFFELTGRLRNKVEIEVVVRQFTERIVLVIGKYVPVEQRGACLDEVIRALQSAGRN
jgi:hypothetical protein